jgi:RimJ/RimL family protein N-acetyltransferase
LAETDLDAYAEMSADPEVMRHIGAGGPVGRDVAWRHLAAFLGEWALHDHGMWALERRSDRALIGRVGFLDPEGWPGCELAWLLARDAWGQSYAFEAAAAAKAFGRDALGLGELISLVRPDNERSIRLAERLGASADRTIDFMGGPIRVYRHAAP